VEIDRLMLAPRLIDDIGKPLSGFRNGNIAHVRIVPVVQIKGKWEQRRRDPTQEATWLRTLLAIIRTRVRKTAGKVRLIGT
jgi:hypothetical protein